MAFDIKKWLMEDMKFSEAEAAEMAPKFTAERQSVIERNIGLGSELTAARAEIGTTQAALKKANDDLEAEMAEWAKLTTKEKTEATELRTSLEAARVRTVQLETRLTNLATEHGLDAKALLEGTAVIPKKEDPVVPPVDLSKYVPADQFGTALNFSLELPAALQWIRDEHQMLTGERLDTREIVKIIKDNATKKGATVDPVAIWEEKYGIAAKRTAKAEADQQKLIAEAEARGEERARSSQALPTAIQPGRHAPVFGQRDAAGQVTPRVSALKRPQPGSVVQNAANALRTHKYRPAEGKTA